MNLPVRGTPDVVSPLLLSALAQINADVERSPDRIGDGRSPSPASSSSPLMVPGAVVAAFELAERPALFRVMRLTPVPEGVLTLIQIAAGSAEIVQRLVRATGRDAAFIHAAAVIYIERVLWCSEGDHYRALGVAPDARPRQLAQHFLWYAKWVSEEWGWGELEDAFAERVLPAWNALKTPELRRHHDQLLLPRQRRSEPPSVAGREKRIPWAEITLRADTSLMFEAPHAAPWQFAAVGAAMIAVAAIATLNWIVLQLPASASASSAAQHVSREVQMPSGYGAEPLADGSRRVNTIVVRAKDVSRLIPLSDN